MDDLRRSLGLLPLVALGAAGVVGTSWIYTNGEFFSLYGAGGEIFGLVVAALLAFVAGWLLIGAYVSSLAFYVTALGQLLTDVVPGMASVPLYSVNHTAVTLPVLAVGVALTLVVFGMNWRGIRLGAQIQLGLFTVMVLLGLVLAVVGFASGSPSNFWPPYAEGDPALAQTVRFVLPGLTFLTGFGLVAILAEDADLSARLIRRAVVLAVAVAASFYVVVLLASAWVIPWERTATMAKGTIDAFDAAGFPVLGWAAYAISVMGLLTSFIALFVATSRILVAMGRAGLLPQALGRLDGVRRTPRTALVFTLAVTLGLGWLGSGAIIWFLDTGGVYIGLAWAIGVACLYRLPRRRPDLRPSRSLPVRILPPIGAVAAVLVVCYALWPGTDLSLVWPQEYIILAAWVALGAALYTLAPRIGDSTALRNLLGEQHADRREPVEER